jgi:outer membrane protein assembly factor BamA
MSVRGWMVVAAALGALIPGGSRAAPAPATTPAPVPTFQAPPTDTIGIPELVKDPVPDACAEGPIVAAELEGCRVRGCDDAAFVAGVLDLADLVPGTVLTPERSAAGLRRLERMGFFRTAAVVCEPVVGGVSVVLKVEVARRLRRLKVKGNSHFDDSEVLGRLAMVSGDRFDPKDATMADALVRARDAVRRAYQEEGFTGTDVTVRMFDVGESQEDLEIGIEEGSRVKIREVLTSLRPARPDDPGASSGAEGCPVIRERDLRKWTELGSATTLTERTIPNTVSRLTKALRSLGFTGVRVKAVFETATEALRVEATYDACYLLRFYSRDRARPGREGFSSLKDEDLLHALPFGDSGVFDLTEAALGRESVRAHFENRGYLFADVVLDYRTRRGPSSAADPDEAPTVDDIPWGPHVAGRISYLVSRGGRVEIRKVLLAGVKSLPVERVREVMGTKEYDFFGDSGAVLPEQVFADLDQVRRLYLEEGFREMRFQGTVEGARRVRLTSTEGATTVFTYASEDKAFQVVVPSGDTEGVRVRIGVEEGARSTMGAIDLTGIALRSVKQARNVLDLHPGGPFSPTRVRAAVQRLTRWYAAAGYLRTSVKVACGPAEATEPCDLEKVQDRVVALRIAVDEGTPATIGAVFVQGLNRTIRDTVTSRLPGPGQPYDVVRVAEGVRFLNNLGIFTSVQVTALGPDEDPPRDRVALVIECREQKSQFVDIAVGFETLSGDRTSSSMPKGVTDGLSTSIALSDLSTSGSGRTLDLPLPDILLTVEARYVDQNFLGRGKRLYLPVKYGLSFTAWDRYASFAPTYLDPNFFSKGLSFRVTPFALYDRATTRLDQVQFGAEFVVSRELVKHLYGSLAWETGVVRTRDPGIPGATYSSWRYENKIVPTLTYDRLDHPIDPRNGGFLQVSLAYINALSQGNFLKYEVLAKGFVTIRKFLTIGLTAHYGGSKALGGEGQLPAEERYSLGGNRGVRGFANDGVAQYNPDGSLRVATVMNQKTNADGTVYIDPGTGQPVLTPSITKINSADTVVSGSLELRFPILRSLDLHGALFYDVGALAESPTDLHAKSLRHSVGVGLRYLLGGVVPIRLDYGIILDRRCKNVDSTTGKCSAREEVGNIHFGVLYTF